MPQFERRLYEPSDDARIFDGGEDNLDEEGSRLPLLIIIALVVLLSFAGVVWLAYTQGVERGRLDAPRIMAEQQNQKIALGEQKNPYANLKIYQPPNSQEEEADANNAQPSPMAAKPQVAAPTSAPGAAATGSNASKVPVPSAVKPLMVGGTKATPNPKSASPAKSQVAPASQTRASMHPATQAPRLIAPGTTPDMSAPQTSVRPPAQSAALNQSAPLPNVQTNMAALNPTAGTTATQSAAPSSGYILQIGSYTSEAEANTSWQSYKQAHPSVAGFSPEIKAADLGTKGTWYRLRVGPFASIGEANAACAKLKAQGARCFPAKQ